MRLCSLVKTKQNPLGCIENISVYTGRFRGPFSKAGDSCSNAPDVVFYCCHLVPLVAYILVAVADIGTESYYNRYNIY